MKKRVNGADQPVVDEKFNEPHHRGRYLSAQNKQHLEM
jgi:hypothetical protein